MTRKEIEQALEKGGFTLYHESEYHSSYCYGEMEVYLDDYLTSFYLGHLEIGINASLTYRNDELFKVEVENHNHQHFKNLKKMTIETQAGESIFSFK